MPFVNIADHSLLRVVLEKVIIERAKRALKLNSPKTGLVVFPSKPIMSQGQNKDMWEANRPLSPDNPMKNLYRPGVMS